MADLTRPTPPADPDDYDGPEDECPNCGGTGRDEAMTEEELLPCPFCGSTAERAEADDGGSFIHCTRCDASTALHFDRKENLVSSWNDRVRPTVPVPVYKAVERILDEESAWIARPSPEVTRRIALAATIAASIIREDDPLHDATP